MFLELLLAIFIGIIAGIFTGLFPGIHINLVALLLFSISTFLLKYFSPVSLVVFIITMTISHTFFDFIPSIFLSAPNEETTLSILPGHRLLLKGGGYTACKLSFDGCLLGIFLLIIFLPLFLWLMPLIYGFLKTIMAFILILASAILVLKEKNKFFAFFVFILSGILGIIVFQLPLKEPLFPLLTGLFGTSMLLTTIKTKPVIPKQEVSEEKLSNKEIAKIIPSSLISSSLCSFLPGLGSSQAAVLSTINLKLNEKSFLFLLGVISTLVTGLNFVAIYSISKPRSGVAVIASKILTNFSLNELWLFMFVILATGILVYFFAIKTAKNFSEKITKINYSRVSFVVLLVLILLTLFFTSWIGILILITATALGIFAIEVGVKKIQLMGCLMVPVILYFL